MLFGEGTMKLWILVGLLTAAAAPAVKQAMAANCMRFDMQTRTDRPAPR